MTTNVDIDREAIYYALVTYGEYNYKVGRMEKLDDYCGLPDYIGDAYHFTDITRIFECDNDTKYECDYLCNCYPFDECPDELDVSKYLCTVNIRDAARIVKIKDGVFKTEGIITIGHIVNLTNDDTLLEVLKEGADSHVEYKNAIKFASRYGCIKSLNYILEDEPDAIAYITSGN